MKVVSSNDKITVYTYVKKDIDINAFVKKLIIRLRKKYKIKMFGFYQINVYKNSKVGLIIDIINEDDNYYFDDLVDLKINIYEDSDVYVCFDDYFWNVKKDVQVLDNKYYIDVNNLSIEDFLLVTEFAEYKYGDELDRIKQKMLINKISNYI